VNATGTGWFGQGSVATSGQHHEAAHDGAERCLVVPLFREGVFINIVDGDPTKSGVPYVMRIGNADGEIVFPHWHPEDASRNNSRPWRKYSVLASLPCCSASDFIFVCSFSRSSYPAVKRPDVSRTIAE